MATQLPSEVGLFQEFLVKLFAGGKPPGSLDEAVNEFREYQRELADLKEKLRIAEEQSARGQTGPFDAEATKRWLHERLAQEGA
jgi:hypothetical protein